MSIFRSLNAFGLRPENGHARRFQSICEIERRLATELHENPFRFFLIVNVEHVLERERLEIKFVARIVIGRNRFRIRVHHDRFKSELTQSEGGMHTAVIELNSLADPVWPTAQDHDLALAALTPLVFVAVGGVVIRRVSFELRRAGVDEAVGGNHACGFSLLADFVFSCSHGEGELPIRKAKFFCAQ